jgi:hypothetical protein
MDIPADAVLQKLKLLCSNLFHLIGSVQTNKRVKGKMKNESGVTVMLIFVTRYKISKLACAKRK